MERTFLVCYIADKWEWRSEKEMPQRIKVILSSGEKAEEAVFYSRIISYTSCACPIILSWSLIEE